MIADENMVTSAWLNYEFKLGRKAAEYLVEYALWTAIENNSYIIEKGYQLEMSYSKIIPCELSKY